MIFPGTEWTHATPAELGVDADTLNAALDYLKQYCLDDGLEEVLVIRNGYVVWAGDSVSKVHNIWSCTKSFTSAITGLLIEEGKIALDRKVAEDLPDLGEQYPEATYEHFLTMTSGFNAKGGSRWDHWESEDWSATPYTPGKPQFAPGTAYTYWDEAMLILGKALTKVAGTTLENYFTERVGTPIGLTTIHWMSEGKVDSLPINYGGSNLEMNALDHARFGHLFLNDGRWAGKQILPEGWADRAMVNQVSADLAMGDTDRNSTDGRGIYGYNWWVINKGEDAPVAAAFTSGLNHNVCLVVPEWNLVLVRMGVDGNPEALSKHELYGELLRRLAPGIDVR